MPSEPSVAVDYADGVMKAVEEHCFSRVDVEVGGFLIGVVDGGHTHVHAAHPAAQATSEQTNLTFTHETWAEVLDALPVEYDGQQIVGWYHSHPGFGCFLSEYDVFIQENFFGSPGQHALVVDPLAGSWSRFVVENGAAVETTTGTTALPALAASVDGVVDSKADVLQPIPPGHRRRWVLGVVTSVVTAVVVGALAWFVGNVQGQDVASARGKAAVSLADMQIAELREQVDALKSAQAAPAASPTPTAPTTQPSDPPAPDVLPIGGVGTFALSHTVRPGDTLWDLSRRYFGDPLRYRELLKANPHVRANGLQPGTRLLVPLPGTLQSVIEER